jgi:hypothetical protein
MDIYGTIALVSLVAIVFGVLFAAYELRQTRLERRHEMYIALLTPLTDGAFQTAKRAVLALPDGLDRATVEVRLGRDGGHLGVWLGTLDTWGLFVHRRQLPLTLVGELAGGEIVRSWPKLSAYVAEVRTETADPAMHAWYQWLAEQWSDREQGSPAVPARASTDSTS